MFELFLTCIVLLIVATIYSIRKSKTRGGTLGMAAMLTLCSLGPPGCAGGGDLSSGQKYAIAVNTYDACVRSMVTASRINVVEPDDYVVWNNSIRLPASALLDRWATAIAAKQPFTELDALNALLDEMVSARVVAERKGSNAPSSGSTGNRTGRGGGVQQHLLRRRNRKLRGAGSDPGRVGGPYLQEAIRRRARGSRTYAPA